MDSRRFRYFVAAIREGSIRAAAEAEHVSQPTVSEQLRLLEEDLGIVLFARSSTGVVPTSAARSILPMVQSVLEAEEEVRDQANRITGLNTGLTTIGTIGVTARSLLPSTIHLIMAEHPGLQFRIEESGSLDIEQSVRSGETDLGLVIQPASGKRQRDFSLTFTKLQSARLVVLARMGHPVLNQVSFDSADLKDYPLILFPEGYAIRREIDALFRDDHINIILSGGSIETRRSVVATGVGISVELELPGDQLELARQGIGLVPLSGDLSHVDVVAVYSANRQPSKSTITILKILQKEAARLEKLHGVRGL